MAVGVEGRSVVGFFDKIVVREVPGRWGIVWFGLTLIVHNWVHNMAYYYAAKYHV